MTGLSYTEAAEAVVRELNLLLTSALKNLIESKHIYQSLAIDFDTAVQKFRPRVFKDYVSAFDMEIIGGEASRQMILAERQQSAQERGGKAKPVLQAVLTNYRLFCPTCKRIEPFKPLWYQDVTNELRKLKQHDPTDPPLKLNVRLQLFALLFQCQGCLDQTATFLLRRDAWKLSVHGRSPIEDVNVPSYIPKQESRWLREAIIARNAGKTLAAILYLRIFIEQFAKRVTGMSGRCTGDEIFAKYSSALPQPLRDSIPSLKEIYDKLSVAIHDAREDDELLETTLTDADRHFDFRRLHRVPEVVSKTRDKGEKTASDRPEEGVISAGKPESEIR